MSVKMSDLFAETKLFRVVLYLGGLVACLLYVLWKAFNASRSVDRVSKKLLLLPLISLLSLAVTWREIILFINEKAKGYPDLKTTFKQAEIFVEAYRSVTDSVQGYWWSSELLMFTLVFIVFINTKGRQISMSIPELCAYTWIGFGGAISASYSLFLYRYNMAISMETKRVEHQQMSRWSIAVLAVCLWLGFICILFLYFSVDPAFKTYLLLTHLLLFIPSLLPSVHVRCYTTTAAKGLIPLIYAILFVAIACHHFYFTHLAIPDAHPETFHKLFSAGFSHNCQASISSDNILCYILSMYYLFLKSGKGYALLSVVPLFLLSPCLSLGSAFALMMLYEEYLLERDIGVKEE